MRNSAGTDGYGPSTPTSHEKLQISIETILVLLEHALWAVPEGQQQASDPTAHGTCCRTHIMAMHTPDISSVMADCKPVSVAREMCVAAEIVAQLLVQRSVRGLIICEE